MGLPFLLEPFAFRDQIVFALLSVIVSWAAIHAIARVLAHSNSVDAPRVGKDPRFWGLRRARADFAQNGKALTEEGYEKYKHSMYWIQTGDMERLVISNRFIDELRKLPDGYLDSRTAVVERNLGWYNGVDIILKSTAHVDVCRTKLVQNLGKHTLRALLGPRALVPSSSWDVISLVCTTAQRPRIHSLTAYHCQTP